MKIRKTAVKGTFYPSDLEETEKMLSEFDKKAKVRPSGRARALIVPHAGLVYSGLTASYAYKYASGFKYRSAVIFAPSHRVGFYGISASEHDEYEYFDQNIPVNRELTTALKKNNGLIYLEHAHKFEHSTEVQLPFIRKYLGDASLAVIVYGETGHQELSYVINDVLDEGKDLVIISTDLSHFHDYETCREIDKKVIEGIEKLDIGTASKGEACGLTGIKAMIQSAADKNLSPEILDYRNSGDVTGDKSGVVGYMSAVLL